MTKIMNTYKITSQGYYFFVTIGNFIPIEKLSAENAKIFSLFAVLECIMVQSSR